MSPERKGTSEAQPHATIDHPSGHDDEAVGEEPPRKVQKTEKRFLCTFEGCGKAYTRAEHLSRHQLNHNPKDIYKCDFPGCTRSFVRQDLCVRHRERHDAPHHRVSDAQSVSSDDEKKEHSSRRVGRPRLSSIHRSDSVTQPRLAPEQVNTMFANNGSFETGSSSALDQLLRLGAATSGSGNISRDRKEPRKNSDVVQDQSNLGPLYNNSASFSGPKSGSGNLNFALPTMPEAFNESPASIRDDFTAWLFDEQFQVQNGLFPSSNFGLIEDPTTFGMDPFSSTFPVDSSLEELLPTTSNLTAEEMEMPVIHQNAWVSPGKRRALLSLMESRFTESDSADITMIRQQMFSVGNRDLDDHVLGMRSMQQYLSSYWQCFHAQMPILHQSTFSSDHAPDLLVLAVMMVGAASLGPQYGRAKTDAASQFATFVAWHLRWQLFMHADFRPPAKLWVFQALLLLEVYEKLYSTRMMHERAHIHSATMINLMRRGTTLTDDSPDGKRTPGMSNPDDAWHRWVEAEAMRRTAFAAFIIDATHAVMFGHAAIMVVHELRVPLPCDDALWSATSAAEVGRVQSSLHTHGVRSLSFLEGLKRILTGRKVKTNTFGRTILIAGLQNIFWHLNQRDLQISSLGASQSLGAPGTWREALTKSFDFWMRDFDDSVQHMRDAALAWHQSTSAEDRDATANASVLHRLSHMASHVEMLDCQIFAGVSLVFGRMISRSDYERTKHKYIEYAKTAPARHGAFHALQLLKPAVTQMYSQRQAYSARNDNLLCRAWSYYHALLVLWCYGFAHEGRLEPWPQHLFIESTTDTRSNSQGQHYWSPPGNNVNVQTTTIPSFDKCLEDAKVFMDAMGTVKTPEELSKITIGRNRLVGLIGLFTPSFHESRWQLLREGASRLEKAVRILKDGEPG